MIDAKKIKKDFPVYKKEPTLSYLDSGATSLKPQIVIDAVTEYYSEYPSNVHRGIYKISERATAEFEGARESIAEFIGAPSSREVIFTRGTTESLNLVVYGLGRMILQKKDEIVTTVIEHHSNFVPWQQLAFEVGADFKIVDLDDDMNLNVAQAITKKTKILAITYTSNVIGKINPIKKIVKAARKINPNIVVVVDGAQTVPHLPVNVHDLDCDFFAFSGHKMCGPTGIGVLWGREKLLKEMFPFQYGGSMIEEVYLDRATFADLPAKYEAGTPHIAGAIGLKAAIGYLQSVGLDQIHSYTQSLAQLCTESLRKEFGNTINIMSEKWKDQSTIVSFNLHGVHPHDLAQVLDEDDVAIRVGHHCAMPLHTRLGLTASARASFYLYNNEEDVEKLVKGLRKAHDLLGKS